MAARTITVPHFGHGAVLVSMTSRLVNGGISAVGGIDLGLIIKIMNE
jgi:hypothetical protein